MNFDTSKYFLFLWYLHIQSIDVPLDFSIGEDFPLSISQTTDVVNAPTLTLAWSFTLAFGFDENSGFFLQTILDEDEDVSELSVQALLDIHNTTFEAKLFFLNARLEEVCLQVGAQINVDVNKASALRLKEKESPGENYGRLSAADMKKIVKVSELFEVSAIAGAAVKIGNDSEIFVDGDGEFIDKVEDWVPRLQFGAAVQLRKELSFGSKKTRRRSLSSSDGHANLVSRADLAKLRKPPIGSSHHAMHQTDHPALPLLRSLGSIEGDIFGNTFAMDFDCPVNVTAGELGCAELTDVTLDIEKIKKVVQPIVDRFVNGKDGYLDEVVQPLLPLDDNIEPLAKLAGKDFTMLDVAEIYVGKAKSGVDTVRKIFAIYNDMVSFAEKLTDTGGIVLATSCDILAGFKCTGGLSGESSRRLQELADFEEMERVFAPVDRAGFPITSIDAAYHRELQSCYTVNKDTCTWPCNGCTGVQKAKCRAAKLKCKGENIDGLKFPPLLEPLKLLNLLKGEDIVGHLFCVVLSAAFLVRISQNYLLSCRNFSSPI